MGKKQKENFFGEWNEAIKKINLSKKVMPINDIRYNIGDKIPHKEGNGYIKVMAIAEGYVMARNKGCIPFCESIDKFIERIRIYC